MAEDGDEPFMTFGELKIEDISKVWHGMDLDTMGRVLRAHLVVEHFMDELLEAQGIDLARLKKARLGVKFFNKQELLGKVGPMSLLWNGVDQLNKIRNTFAHDPRHQLTEAETARFYDPTGHFQNYLGMWCEARSVASPAPIQIVEAFAESAAALFLATARMAMKIKTVRKAHGEELLVLAGQRQMLDALRDDEEDAEPSTEP